MGQFDKDIECTLLEARLSKLDCLKLPTTFEQTEHARASLLQCLAFSYGSKFWIGLVSGIG